MVNIYFYSSLFILITVASPIIDSVRFANRNTPNRRTNFLREKELYLEQKKDEDYKYNTLISPPPHTPSVINFSCTFYSFSMKYYLRVLCLGSSRTLSFVPTKVFPYPITLRKNKKARLYFIFVSRYY